MVLWNVAEIAEEDVNSFVDHVSDAPLGHLHSPGGLQTHRGMDTLTLHNIRVAGRSPLPSDCGKQTVVQPVQCCRCFEEMGGSEIQSRFVVGIFASFSHVGNL